VATDQKRDMQPANIAQVKKKLRIACVFKEPISAYFQSINSGAKGKFHSNTRRINLKKNSKHYSFVIVLAADAERVKKPKLPKKRLLKKTLNKKIRK
jgi:hypothetical protein